MIRVQKILVFFSMFLMVLTICTVDSHAGGKKGGANNNFEPHKRNVIKSYDNNSTRQPQTYNTQHPTQPPTYEPQSTLYFLNEDYITVQERSIIDRYIKNYQHYNNGSLPPGLAKRGSLPPGLARQLYRNGTLPPGLQTQPLPYDLLHSLPVRSEIYTYRYIDGRILLIEAATNLIVDIFQF